jgi:predicted RND superfamily exporter protein
MAVGLATAQIISLLLIPAWLSLTRDRSSGSTVGKEEDGKGWLGKILCRLFIPLLARRRLTLAIFGITFALAAVLASRIHVEDAGAQYFPEHNQFRQADEFVNSHLAGTSPGWIEIRGEQPGAMLTTAMVEFIERLDDFLMSQPQVTYTYSLAKYVKRMNYVLNDMVPTYDRLPQAVEQVRSIDPTTNQEVYTAIDGDAIIRQAVLMYENGGGQDLTNVLNSEASGAVTMFTMNTTRASQYKQLLHSLDEWLKEHKPAHTTVSVAGTPVIWSSVLDEIVVGQALSIILALVAVTTVLMLWLRSVRLGVLAALPLATTIVLYYAFMSLMGIDLNIGTAIISFLVVGIVDYSVHYLHRIRHALEQERTLDQALLHALRYSGNSIAFNVLLFSLGFLALLASDFTPIFHLGVLVALALTISGCMSLFLISLLAPWFILQPVIFCPVQRNDRQFQPKSS